MDKILVNTDGDEDEGTSINKHYLELKMIALQKGYLTNITILSTNEGFCADEIASLLRTDDSHEALWDVDGIFAAPTVVEDISRIPNLESSFKG